jgi:hypothetical protein
MAIPPMKKLTCAFIADKWAAALLYHKRKALVQGGKPASTGKANLLVLQ